jgi:hypothetical protein
MSWTPKFISKSKEKGRGYVNVRFLETSGEYIDEQFSVTPDIEAMKAIVQSRVDNLNATYAFIDNLALVPNQTIDTTPASKSSLQLFHEDLDAMAAHQGAIACQVETYATPAVQALITKISDQISTNPTWFKYIARLR